MDIWRGTRPGRYKGRNYESVKSSTQLLYGYAI